MDLLFASNAIWYVPSIRSVSPLESYGITSHLKADNKQDHLWFFFFFLSLLLANAGQEKKNPWDNQYCREHIDP